MTTDNMRQRVFRRMLVQAAGAGADAPGVAAAARRLCERFAHQLIPLIGDAGVAAIYARSLHLTRQFFPRPAASVRASGRDDGPCARAQYFLEQQESAVVTDAAVAVLTTISELLESFIGQSLTTCLLRETWPDDFGGDTQETPS